MNLGEKLKQERKIVNMTQKDVAEQIGVAMTTYATWEQCRAMPPYEMLIKLSKLYEVTTDYLLEEDCE